MTRAFSSLAVQAAFIGALTGSASAQDVGTPTDVLITFERTTCFGTCPAYTVSIDGAGRVVYEGRRFVRVTGRQTAQVDPAEVAKLVSEFWRAGFFEMKDEYSYPITDQPTQFLTMTLGGRSKRIRDYYGAPKALKELEARVDEVAETRRWVYVDPKTVADLRARGERLPAGEDVKQLVLAARRDDLDVVRSLLQSGADPNAIVQSGALRPLFEARSAAVARALIDGGADVNLAMSRGMTPLGYHSQWSDPAIVELLLRAGALVNAKDKDGRTPLFYAEARLREDEDLAKQSKPHREPRLDDRRRTVALLRGAGGRH